jgi:hypothetical protein
VIAWQGHRGEKLHLCEDARLMASELDREWPNIEHWAAPATADEIRAHGAQAARLNGPRSRFSALSQVEPARQKRKDCASPERPSMR